MRKILQFLISIILISLTSCQSKADKNRSTEGTAKIKQEDSLDNRPSQACIDRSHWYQYAYMANDIPGRQMENFDPDTITKYEIKYVEITSSLYGLISQFYFDSTGRIGLMVQNGNSPSRPKTYTQISYSSQEIKRISERNSNKVHFSNSRSSTIKRVKNLEILDTNSLFYKKSISFQWPIGIEIIPRNNGWYRRSYIDTVLVYEGIVTINNNCDSIVLKDYRKSNIDHPFNQNLTHCYTECFVFEDHNLKRYRFKASKELLQLKENNWPNFIKEEYTYSSGQLLESITRKRINESGEINEIIYYKYSKSVP